MNRETQSTRPTPAASKAKKKVSTAQRKVAKKTSPTKKSRVKKKPAKTEQSRSTHTKAAADSRHVLIDKLRKDLRDAKETMKAAKVAAKDEIAVLKDHLDAALKRERELLKISEKKVRKMLAAGERWEKKQVTKIVKAAKAARKLV